MGHSVCVMASRPLRRVLLPCELRWPQERASRRGVEGCDAQFRKWTRRILLCRAVINAVVKPPAGVAVMTFQLARLTNALLFYSAVRSVTFMCRPVSWRARLKPPGYVLHELQSRFQVKDTGT